MTVYEMIQKLSGFNADDEVRFQFSGNFEADVMAEFDRDDENDEQEVTVEVNFSDKLTFDDIHKKYFEDEVYIDLTY